MRYCFDDFTLDLDRGLLLENSRDIATEPRAFALLTLLITNHDRMVSKDEIVEKVWDGRIVTDAAIATVIKTARKALGDDGATQKYVSTLRGRGLRFVGEVMSVSSAQVHGSAGAPPSQEPASTRPSIAILPFRLLGQPQSHGAIADAIPAELISCLSRLRWVTVVSRGSTFRFRHENPDLTAIRDTLGASYCLTGIVETFGTVISMSAELSDTSSQLVIWSERFSGAVSDLNQIRNDIVAHVISALELHIPLHEAERARLRPPESLDAWGVYHLGLQNMYRFNKADNLEAARLFERATTLDPGFARAYAARSFTSFQNNPTKNAFDKCSRVDVETIL